MGCHTWFYKKVNRSEEDAKRLALDELENKINLVKEYIDTGMYKEAHYYDFTPEQNLEAAEWEIKLYERCIIRINKKISSKLYWYFQPEDLNHYDPKEGFFIEDDTTPHDIFRIGDYPDDHLYSLPETLRFCVKKEIKLTKDQKYQLQKFWSDYPDGMIRFG